MTPTETTRVGTERARPRPAARHTLTIVLMAIALPGIVTAMSDDATAFEPANAPASHFPSVPAGHTHARALLKNATRYAAPGNRIIDPASGYPFEGWNQDPKRGLFLRSFTQLTAIGQWMEFLANVVAGQAETPHLSRDQALAGLKHLVSSLRQDQRDPRLGVKGLLVNFLDLATGKRLGPLASDVDRKKVFEVLGRQKGEAVWKALQAKGWIVTRNADREAEIRRIDGYGSEHFDGPLAPFADGATKQKVMDVLDQRVVMVVFGDNSNLSASAAKAVGALLTPAAKDRPGVAELRHDLEQFLEAQREGYAQLYDAKAGLFYFGWDATKDRLFGWDDLQGNWTTGHMDYLVNEFRGPTTFVALKFGLPLDAVANLGFKIKPYSTQARKDLYVLAPWEGSAFQAMGLSLSMGELTSPSWRGLLRDVVAVETDYAARKRLPGFLSESYTGEGVQYTGAVGIPEITVSPRPRLTDAASLYTLGVAYSIAPDQVEAFLKANWPVVATLLTDHGPWEGFNTTRQEPIAFQTTAHTLSLILGLLGTGSDHMTRYLESTGAGGRLAELYRTGEGVDLLSDRAKVFAWTEKGNTVQSSREQAAFRVRSDRAGELGIAFVADRPEGVNLSGGVLSLRYRSAQALGDAVIALKPVANAQSEALIAKEIYTRLVATAGGDAEVRVPLPATPGLARVKEVVITSGRVTNGRRVDLTITGFAVGKPGD